LDEGGEESERMRLIEGGRIFRISYRLEDMLDTIWVVFPGVMFLTSTLGGVIILVFSVALDNMTLWLFSMLMTVLGVLFGVWIDYKGLYE
jgi:hypothetical protein